MQKSNLSCAACDDHHMAEPMKLVSGYNTRLCLRCLNEWDKFILTHPVYWERRRCDVAIDMTRLRTGQDGIDRSDEMMALLKRSAEIDMQLVVVAHDWCEQG